MSKKRRSWSCEEKMRLIDALKYSIVKGWRGDNGFRTGHLVFLEEQLKEAIPGAIISAEPHIKSMLHVWKRQYGFLSGVLGKSGVNWNPMLKKVECSKEAWDEGIEGCKAFAEMKNKQDESWPFYEDWIEIFGKDRATGDNSLDFVEAINGVLNGNATPIDPTTVLGDDDLLSSSAPDDGEQILKEATSGSCATMSKNKRKASSIQVEDPYKEVVSSLLNKTDDALVQVMKHLAPDKDDKKARQSVYEALGAFPELTVAMKVSIGKKLATNREELDFFFSLPREARQELVTQMREAK